MTVDPKHPNHRDFLFAAAVRMVMSVISFFFLGGYVVCKVEPNDIMGDILLDSEH